MMLKKCLSLFITGIILIAIGGIGLAALAMNGVNLNGISIGPSSSATPLENVEDYPELNRKITDSEYDEVIDFAISIGVENAFIQEGETQSESFIPDFDCGEFLEEN